MDPINYNYCIGECSKIESDNAESNAHIQLDELDQFCLPPEAVNATTTKKSNSSNDSRDSNLRLRKSLEKYYESSFVPNKETADIIVYWRNHARNASSDEFEDFILLAEVIYSVPATQVTVERLFSHLRYVFSDLRCSLASSIIDDIIVCRMNWYILGKKDF